MIDGDIHVLSHTKPVIARPESCRDYVAWRPTDGNPDVGRSRRVGEGVSRKRERRLSQVGCRQCPSLSETSAQFFEIAAVIVHLR